MPFDNTPLTEFDQDTATLIRAREILVKDGWCVEALKDNQGRHCVTGAIVDALGGNVGFDSHSLNDVEEPIQRVAFRVIERLSVELVDIGGSWYSTVSFNNAQKSVEPVLALLDKAIARPRP